MNKKELEKRIEELEKLVEQKDTIITLLQSELDYERNKEVYTYPSTDFQLYGNICTDGKPHEYPFPWFSVTPPFCMKCGKQAPNMEITFNSPPATGDPVPPQDYTTSNGTRPYNSKENNVVDGYDTLNYNYGINGMGNHLEKPY